MKRDGTFWGQLGSKGLAEHLATDYNPLQDGGVLEVHCPGCGHLGMIGLLCRAAAIWAGGKGDKEGGIHPTDKQSK